MVKLIAVKITAAIFTCSYDAEKMDRWMESFSWCDDFKVFTTLKIEKKALKK